MWKGANFLCERCVQVVKVNRVKSDEVEVAESGVAACQGRVEIEYVVGAVNHVSGPADVDGVSLCGRVVQEKARVNASARCSRTSLEGVRVRSEHVSYSTMR